jgi:hypothetical protein
MVAQAGDAPFDGTCAWSMTFRMTKNAKNRRGNCFSGVGGMNAKNQWVRSLETYLRASIA